MFLFNHDLVLLGSQYPLDEDTIPWLRSKSSISPIKRDLEVLGINRIESLANYEVVAARASFQDAGIQTLEYPKLSYLAGYDFFLGSTSSISNFNQDLRWQKETWKLEQRSLLRLLAESRYDGKPLKHMLRYACNFSSDKIPENWKSYKLPCQRLFIAAIFSGELAENSLELSASINLLRKTQSNASIAPLVTSKEAAELAKFAVTYRSAWLPLNIDNILINTQSCEVTNSECRLYIAQLLVIQGNSEQAKEILNSIAISSLSNQLRKTHLELKTLLDESALKA
jgi:hypothetical protein